MKNWIKSILIFVAGMITTVLIAVLLSPGQSDGMRGLTVFPERGNCLSRKEFKVFQVLEPTAALASEKSNEEYGWFNGKTVLIVNNDGKYYYNDEIIKMPAKKCAKQLGVYTYPTKEHGDRTVPAVIIE